MVQSTSFLQNVSGPLEYTLTNDYMFRALMQTSNETLRHLLAALLRVPYEEIRSCEILNPIVLGEAIDYKTCIMDVRICMNNDRMINLEMQVKPHTGWSNRALFYLCRLFCNIHRGQKYGEILPSVHIGILGSSPFKEVKEFYSRYELTNIKNMHIYTGNFSLLMIDLSQIDNAPEEIRSTELYTWARLFRATTWEEIKMLANTNKIIEEASRHLHILTEDEKIRLQCEGRFRYECDMASARGEGFDEGKAAGMAEGEAKGMAEGEARGRAESILDLLSELGPVSGELEERIRGESDAERLRKWLIAASAAETMEDFLSRMASPPCDF